ncbi:2'-5' RNA ligase family protein [Pseudomaricurvus sp.]|uniref:2'-5' RNA ligase family protein n=1 Tax=Pseudomaricurvus sp. TaxID=2004510 RepID=UPI003F6D9B33
MSFYYPQVYQTFLDGRFTLPSRSGEYPDWHKGREHYYCWAVSVDSAAIASRWRAAQQHYAYYLREDYHHQLHITVAVCGFWQPKDLTTAHNDDYTPDMLERQVKDLEAMASKVALHNHPEDFWSLDVGGVNSFLSAPFLEVRDDHGALSELRQLLLPNGEDFRSEVYCPHITLGLYRDRFETATIATDFSSAIDTMPLKMNIQTLDLLSYDARSPTSPLRRERSIELYPTTDTL